MPCTSVQSAPAQLYCVVQCLHGVVKIQMQQNSKLIECSKKYHIPLFGVFIMHKPGYVWSWDQYRVAKQVFCEGQVHVGTVDNSQAMVAVLQDVTIVYQEYSVEWVQ